MTDNFPKLDRKEPPLITDDDLLFNATIVSVCAFLAIMAMAGVVLK